MAKLTGTVGNGGQNAKQDVLLVQLMLHAIKTSKERPYLDGSHDGQAGPAVVEAITSFQSDPVGKKPLPGVIPDKTGVIAPGGDTFMKLSALLPEKLKRARTTAGVSVAYLEMGDAALRASIAVLHSSENNLHGEFSTNLIALVQEFYKQTGIVITVNKPFGGWRDYDMQVSLVSQGGPGETIHNYGRAVDVGFLGLQWIDSAGNVKDAYVKGQFVGPPASVQIELRDLRRKTAQRSAGLYPTMAFKGGDPDHIQAVEDGPLDSAGSFVALMEAFGPRKMKWELFEMTPTRYKCDLGLGGEKYLVGRSVDIWVVDPEDRRWKRWNPDPFRKFNEDKEPVGFALKKADLVTAMNAKSKIDPKFSFDTFLGTREGTHAKAPLSLPDVSDADMKAVHLIVLKEMEAAASHWRQWKPIHYRSAARRPEHNKKPH